MKQFSLFLSITAAIFLTACSGYQPGASGRFESIRKLHVEPMRNTTLFTRAGVIGHNSFVDGLTRFSTFTLTPRAEADGALITDIRRISYDQVRSTRLDTLRSEELDVIVQINWKLLDNKSRVIEYGRVDGNSRIFVADNLQRAREAGLADAMRSAAQKLSVALEHGVSN